MESKRILVLCGGKFAFPSLQSLGIEKFLCAVGIGKGEKEALSVLETESRNSGLPFMSFPGKENLAGLRHWIDEIQPDYIFSISFPFLLTDEILSYGEDKFINFHPGPLPEYRGPMPLFEVLRYQERETAISVHFMDPEFDEGAIILQEKIALSKNETYGELAVKLSERTAMVAVNLAHMLQFASVVPKTEQDENKARYFEKREPAGTLIQWNRMPAEEIIALIHACNPWNQGADAVLAGKSVKIPYATVSEEQHMIQAGQIIQLTRSGALAVSCMDGVVILIPIIINEFGILTAEKFFTSLARINIALN